MSMRRTLALWITLSVLTALSFGFLGATPESRAASVDAAAWQGIDRIAGADRYATAIAVSKEAFPSGSDAVVICTAANWPDALCAAPLAAAAGGPILLTPSTGGLPGAVVSEISRLDPTRAYIAGGTGAVPSDVDGQLASMGVSVTRLAGSDRYHTSKLVAAEITALLGQPSRYFVATGEAFPDALAASAIAADLGMPILLTPRDTLRAEVPTGAKAYLLGGPGAISEAVGESLVTRLGVSNVMRLEGADRYATAVAVVRHAANDWGTDLSTLGLSSGANYPDALSAGVLLGMRGQAQLLTAPTALSSGTKSYMSNLQGTTSRVTILGGTGAVGTAVETGVRSVLDPDYVPGEVAKFSGSGTNALGPFSLAEGLTVVSSEHAGSGHFSVVLLDKNGNWVDLMANDIGDISVSSATNAESSGSYYLDVDADGDWTITVSQPRPDVSTLPYTASFSGSGQTATDMFRLAGGARRVSFSHSGSGHFGVVLLDRYGNWVDLIANEIGSTSGSTVVGVEDGAYLFNVEADGAWSITIE